MNGIGIEQDIVEILRRNSLSGSDRTISLHDPLGELGLGLDSLALVEFVSALEKRYRIELPDTIWTERGRLTVRHFVDLVSGLAPAVVSPARDMDAAPREEAGVGDAASRRNLKRVDRHRRDGEKKGKLVSFIRRLLRLVYHRETFVIIEFKLSDRPLPSYSSQLNLVFREASEADADSLCAFWGSLDYRTVDKKAMSLDLFRKRLDSGYACLVACLDDKIVGMDWLVDKGYPCPFTGLELSWPSDTCYAGELYEHPQHQGRGVGLALLAFSLADAKRRGYRRQVSWVTAHNTKMLSVSLQLMGFTKIGRIDIRRVFRRPFSTWDIGGRAGRGGTAIL